MQKLCLNYTAKFKVAVPSETEPNKKKINKYKKEIQTKRKRLVDFSINILVFYDWNDVNLVQIIELTEKCSRFFISTQFDCCGNPSIIAC